jgi:hypothetical protein
VLGRRLPILNGPLLIIPTSTTNAIAKSTRPVTTAASGMINRGKYTFVSTCALSTRLLLD